MLGALHPPKPFHGISQANQLPFAAPVFVAPQRRLGAMPFLMSPAQRIPGSQCQEAIPLIPAMGFGKSRPLWERPVAYYAIRDHVCIPTEDRGNET